jgi:hypothetical protein
LVLTAIFNGILAEKSEALIFYQKKEQVKAAL